MPGLRIGIVLALLLVIHVLAHVDRSLLAAFAPQISNELHLSDSQYGLLVGAVFTICYALTAPVMGSLADRIARPRLIAGAIVVWSVCTAATGLTANFLQMSVVRAFVAIGEATLVPAATALIADLVPERWRGAAIGTFFMGIPIGTGTSFAISSIGASQVGWRGCYFLLGAIGLVLAALIASIRDQGRRKSHSNAHGSFAGFREVAKAMRDGSPLPIVLAGIVMLHVYFAGLYFAQLWLVRERGFDQGHIAGIFGVLLILFGCLGALVGGALGDLVASFLRAGRAWFLVALIVLLAPVMVAYRVVDPSSPLFFVGMSAGFFFSTAFYGPAFALLQDATPPHLRSTVTGVAMMLVNVFAIGLGSFVVGAAGEELATFTASPLTDVLIAVDLVVAAGALLFATVAIRGAHQS